MKVFIVTILTIFILSVITVRIVKSVSINQNCTGYLKLAADANTVETAKEQLQKSIHYLESNKLTDGYTSVLWKTPDEDVGFWYKNLKASEKELMKVDSTTTSMEKTNLLMKLRETLLDNGEKGTNITVPDGLSVYPNNLIWGILSWLALLSFTSLLLIIGVEFD